MFSSLTTYERFYVYLFACLFVSMNNSAFDNYIIYYFAYTIKQK